jgi:CdiI immunity protein
VIEDTYPHLWQLLGAYFHQDWDLEGPDWQSVIAAYRAESDPEDAACSARDISALLAATLDDAELERLFYDAFGCGYYPPGAGLTVREWLLEVRRALEWR